MPSFWARLVYALGWLQVAPPEEAGLTQYPLPAHNRPPVVIDQPFDAEVLTGGPEFYAPDTSSWAELKCRYPSMVGYQNCSTPGDRSCWLKDVDGKGHKDFNISTNYEIFAPKGVLRKYYIEVEEKNITMEFGKIRTAMTINGTLPGPWIQACWGDTVEVTVKNKLKHHGTTIHWHGVRMLNNSLNDGVNAITQCPIAPEETFTYRFEAQQYGTSWYHSHYGLQYGDGVLGPLTIHGPSSADYDEAKYPVMMSDFSYESFLHKWQKELLRNGTENNATFRTLDGILLNGTGTPAESSYLDDEVRRPFTLHFNKGKRYLLRLINHSVEATFVFSIDNHKLQVVSADFVPIVPYMTDHVVIGIGQRYNVIVMAEPKDGFEDENDPKGAFWIRTELSDGCDFRLKRRMSPGYDKTGVIRYTDDDCQGGFGKIECTPKNKRGTFNTLCRDEPYDKLKPIVPWTVGKPKNVAANSQFELGLDKFKGEPFWPVNKTLEKWNMYTDTMWLNFGKPTIRQVLNGPPKKYESKMVVVQEKVDMDSWMYFLINGNGIPRTGRRYIPAAHPIHLHGHDFALLEQSTTPYTLGNLTLNTVNPPRRDVVLLPSDGYVVVAFKADNPGVWLMHCHIAWHASAGLAMQLLENVDEIKLTSKKIDIAQMEETCRKWDVWATDPENNFLQDDSGI